MRGLEKIVAAAVLTVLGQAQPAVSIGPAVMLEYMWMPTYLEVIGMIAILWMFHSLWQAWRTSAQEIVEKLADDARQRRAVEEYGEYDDYDYEDGLFRHGRGPHWAQRRRAAIEEETRALSKKYRTSQRSVATQSQCKYTWHSSVPRFVALPTRDHGAWFQPGWLASDCRPPPGEPQVKAIYRAKGSEATAPWRVVMEVDTPPSDDASGWIDYDNQSMSSSWADVSDGQDWQQEQHCVERVHVAASATDEFDAETSTWKQRLNRQQGREQDDDGFS